MKTTVSVAHRHIALCVLAVSVGYVSAALAQQQMGVTVRPASTQSVAQATMAIETIGATNAPTSARLTAIRLVAHADVPGKIEHLVANIDFWDPRAIGGTEMFSPGKHYPCAGALVAIGTPCVNPVIAAALSERDEKRLALYKYVLREIETATRAVGATLASYTEERDPPIERNGIQDILMVLSNGIPQSQWSVFYRKESDEAAQWPGDHVRWK